MITLNTNFANPNLPLATSFAQQVAALSDLRSWWRVDADTALVGTGVASIPDRAGAAGVPLAMSTESQQPIYTPDAFGRYPSAKFDGGNDYLRANPVPYTKTEAFSWVWIGTMPETGETDAIVALFASVGASTLIRTSTATNGIVFQHGNGTASVGGVGIGVPALIIGSSDTENIRLYVNGTTSDPVATDNVQTASTFVVGAANTSGTQAGPQDLAELMVFQRDILADADTVALLADYAAQVYGVGA